MGAGYLQRIVPVTTTAGQEIVGSNSVCPKPLDAAHFEKKVLFRLINVRASSPKMFSDWYRLVDFDIQGTLHNCLSCGFTKYFGIISDAFLEVLPTLLNLPFLDYQ